MTTKACNVCGKTTDIACSKCKDIYYCGREHQIQDWPDHKAICKRKELKGAPCDACQDTEEKFADVCQECGFIFCNACNEKMTVRDQQGEVTSFGSCPGCHTRRRVCQQAEYKKKLEKLIKEKKGDPREALWVVKLGLVYLNEEMNEQMAKQCYLRAGELGLGDGYTRLAEIYAKQGEWDEARRYYRKAADRMEMIAIQVLGIDALCGYLTTDGQESPRRVPDLKEAFRLFREGASLGNVGCCYRLGDCYLLGQGTKQSDDKAFKWIQKAAEKGHVNAMILYGQFYCKGKVVEHSIVQAKYWLDKALQSEQGTDGEKEAARKVIRKYNL